MQAVLDRLRLGQVVRDARQELARSQFVLADRAGVPRAWVAKLGPGHRRAKAEQVFRVLNALGLAIILKAGTGRLHDQALAEHATMRAAAEAGVPTAATD
ncbi:MAG: hypothetical protein ACP5VR_01780 [Acidimicrobiales bacterium]